MRKILAGFMATSMIVAMASATAFAKVDARGNTYELDMSSVKLEASADDSGLDGTKTIAAGAASIVLTDGNGETLTIVSKKAIAEGADAKAIAAAFAGVAVGDITPSASLKYADGTTAVVAADVKVKVNSNGTITITTSKTGSDFALEFVSASVAPSVAGANDGNLQFTDTTLKFEQQLAQAATTNVSDVDISSNLDPNDVLVCDDYGNPIAMVKDGSGVKKQINDGDGVQSDNKVYFMIQDNGYNPSAGTNVPYGDEKYFKIKVNKGDNAKQVKSTTVLEKNLSSSLLYDVTNGGQVPGTSGRHRFIEVVLNPNYTTDEYKLTFDVRVTPTTSAVDRKYAKDGDELKIRDFSFYMKNIERAADNDWSVGINGLMLKPVSNDWNDVTWYDEDGDLAHMKFFADSDVDSFYSKLSTKWPHVDYAAYFNDQDAYLFDFTGSPKLSATSRADLEIYNPFVDEDGNETIDPSTAVIYQIIDGDLIEVTDSFKYEEAESGDMAFKTRTRFLGTYVICEKAVEEAVDNADVPADLVPEDTTPSEVTPDNNNGGKAPANTGKYL